MGDKVGGELITLPLTPSVCPFTTNLPGAQWGGGGGSGGGGSGLGWAVQVAVC